jgi:electron transfer flavoprotein alpha/beta subunit
MVTSSRTPAGPDRVRSLNLPRPILVTLDEHTGLPRLLHERNRVREIERVQDVWHVDDEWWREPISRQYLQVVLRGGALRTLFHDRLTNRWFTQTY